MKAILAFLALLILGTAANAAQVDGYWTGVALRGGKERSVSLWVQGESAALQARFDIPALGLEGIPLDNFSYDSATREFSARSFKGRLSGDHIIGDLVLPMLHGPPAKVDLTRADNGPPAPSVRERPVQFKSRGFLIKGTLVSPLSAGRVPALVSLHGSGPSTRWSALARARRFAEAGYAMLIFDKPGSGESEGDWTMTSLDDMGQDAIAAVEFLRAQPEINSSKVGLWGHSQAGNIVSRAGVMSDHIAFSIVLAGGGVTPREIEEIYYLGQLRRANASPAATERAMAWVRAYLSYEASGVGYDALVRELKDSSNGQWTRALGVQTVYPTPKQQPKWRWVATYDPLADISRIRFPVLLLFADKDEYSPPERSLARWQQGLAAGGNRKIESKTFADTEHHFLTPARTSAWPSVAPGFYETQIDWLRRVVGR